MANEREFLEALASDLEHGFDSVELFDEPSGPRVFVDRDNGSPILGVSVSELGDSILIEIRSIVVREISNEVAAEAYLLVNDLNLRAPIGRWIFSLKRGFIGYSAEQLLVQGQVFDQEELNVFRTLMGNIYATLDELDDRLLEELGSGLLAKEDRPPLSLGDENL